MPSYARQTLTTSPGAAAEMNLDRSENPYREVAASTIKVDRSI